ncbi:O-antigen polymerase [Nocardioides sp.]|uniref:O-antigen polymerase n=1 Tax=Nocardioides sp. TaxID=35761 RepID=UPI003D119DBE
MLTPSRIFAAYWLALIAAALIFYPGSLLSWGTIRLILLMVGAFTLGVLIAGHGGSGGKTPAKTGPSVDTSKRRLLVGMVRLGVLCNVLAAVLALRSHGFAVTQVLSLPGLLSTANSVTVARYSGAGGSLFVPPLLGIGYAAALVSPTLRFYGAGWLTVLAPVLSSLAFAAVTTERLGLLISAALTAGSLISNSVVATGSAPRLSKRIVAGALVAGLTLGAAFTSVAFIRVGRIDPQIADVIYQKQKVYALGSLPAFSEWLERNNATPVQGVRPGWGTSTLAGVEYVTGRSREATRAYDEFEMIDSQGSRSNVYTVFRGLIMDFGVAGAILLLALAGFVFGRVFRRVQITRSLPWAAVLACFYAVILLTNTMAITSFTNVIGAMVLGVATLAWRSPGRARENGTQRLGSPPPPRTKRRRLLT